MNSKDIEMCPFGRYEGGLGLGEQQSMGVDDNYCDLYKQQRRHGLRRQNEELHSRWDFMQEEMRSLQSSNYKLTKENEQLKHKLQTQCSAHENEMFQWKSRCENLQHQFWDMQRAKEHYEAVSYQLQQGSKQLKIHEQQLQYQMAEHQQQWTQVQERQKRELDAAKDELQREKASTRKESMQLNKRIKELEEEITEQLEKINTGSKVISELRGRLEKKNPKPDPAIVTRPTRGRYGRSPKVRPANERDSTTTQMSQARCEELEEEMYKLKQELKEKNEQIRLLQSEGNLASHNQRGSAEHRHGQEIHDQRLSLDQLYLTVEGEGTKQHRVVKKRLQALREHIDDLVAEVDSETTPLRSEAIEYSGDYKDFNLGFRILLCSLLQVCYDACKCALVHQVTEEAVTHWRKDASPVSVFSREVSFMIRDSMADECRHLEKIAPCLVSQAFNPTVSVPDKELQQYTAVYKLITEYVKMFCQDYPSVILEEMKAGKALEHVSVDPNVEGFLKKIVPMCWELVTIYNPPIFVCGGSISRDGTIVINGAFHEKHPESRGKSNVIQSFLFPLVYKDYGGDVQQKAVVLTRRC